MPLSINTAAVDSYIETLTEKLVFSHFNTKEFINGSEIQELTELDQVNVFILQLLFSNWKKEAENLKSPYFNFENEDVKTALQDFLNSLSFHIRVDRAHFQPLIKDAISNTLDLILHPYNYITQSCLCLEEIMVSEEHIRSKTKYIKINKFLIEDALNAFTNKDRIPVEDFLNTCSQIYLKRKEDFYKIEDFVKVFDYLIPEEHSQAFFIGKEDDTKVDDDELPSIDDHIEEKVEREPFDFNAKEPIHEQPVSAPENTTPVNDRFKETELSLADALAEQGPISLKENIPFNDRYAFLNTLFEGNNTDFDQAIEKADAAPNAAEAITELKQSYEQTYNWGDKEETLERLISYLERKS